MTLLFNNPHALLWLLPIIGVTWALIACFKSKSLAVFALCATAVGASGFVVSLAEPQAAEQVTTEQTVPHKVIGLHDSSGSESSGMEDPDSTLDRYNLNPKERVTRFSVNRDAFREFAKQRPFDEIALTTFDDKAKIWTRLGEGPTFKTISELTSLPEPNNGTNLVEGLTSAVEQFKQAGPSFNDVLIIGSDGEDEIASSKAGRIVADLINLNVRVYWVRVSREPMSMGAGDLQRLVKEVGGTQLDATTPAEAKLAYQKISLAEPFFTEPHTETVTTSATSVCVISVLLAGAGITLLVVWGLRRRASVTPTVVTSTVVAAPADTSVETTGVAQADRSGDAAKHQDGAPAAPGA